MRLHKIVIFLVLALSCSVVTGGHSSDSSLESSVRSMLDASTFDINILDKNASIVVAHGTDHRFYTPEELQEVLDLAKTTGTRYGVSGFKILQEDLGNGQFASIVYRVVWKSTVDDVNTTTVIVSHEIWERQGNKWNRVFAALDATPQ